MQVKVLMLAFEREGVVRLVDVPDDEITDDPMEVMERVFYWGQNDFQPQNICSVSMGDIAEYQGKYYFCGHHWEEISSETVEIYKLIPRRGRGIIPYMLNEIPN